MGNSQTVALYKHGAHLKPPSGSYSRVPEPTQTHERKEQLSCRYLPLFISFRSPSWKKKGRTCPFSETHMKDSPDREYSGNKRALCVRAEIWLFVAGDNLRASISPRELAAALFSRRVEVNKDIFRVNPECRGGTGEVSSLVLPDEPLAHFTCMEAQAVTPLMGSKGTELGRCERA